MLISDLPPPFSTLGLIVFIVGGLAVLWRGVSRVRKGERAFYRPGVALRQRSLRSLSGWPVDPATEIFVGVSCVGLSILALTR
jgi:hypothetical protein